ncbi:MAG: hypothetical protein COY70_03005 [Candidatus Magasanikbacteria bacterium CG_4_10_14_0_8_um_filter_42_12]|nr:MAG: hypothetical protein COY70_03005 [Candidatus Magasanikbacteria bacterium CG_4_10_14_0_8_um_filter_42_12]
MWRLTLCVRRDRADLDVAVGLVGVGRGRGEGEDDQQGDELSNVLYEKPPYCGAVARVVPSSYNSILILSTMIVLFVSKNHLLYR